MSSDSNLKRAQTTLSMIRMSDGRLSREQSQKFMSCLMEIIREENRAWNAAKWYQRLWYSIKLIYWRIRGWERVPFNVRVIKFKQRGR